MCNNCELLDGYEIRQLHGRSVKDTWIRNKIRCIKIEDDHLIIEEVGLNTQDALYFRISQPISCVKLNDNELYINGEKSGLVLVED